MPIKKVDGKYKYGDSGKLYESREDAIRQMKAIHASGYEEDEDDEREKRRKKAAKKRAAEMVTSG
jgi:hypothetical protein